MGVLIPSDRATNHFPCLGHDGFRKDEPFAFNAGVLPKRIADADHRAPLRCQTGNSFSARRHGITGKIIPLNPFDIALRHRRDMARISPEPATAPSRGQHSHSAR